MKQAKKVTKATKMIELFLVLGMIFLTGVALGLYFLLDFIAECVIIKGSSDIK